MIFQLLFASRATASHVVYDSPLKSTSDIRECLRLGVGVNIDCMEVRARLPASRVCVWPTGLHYRGRNWLHLSLSCACPRERCPFLEFA